MLQSDPVEKAAQTELLPDPNAAICALRSLSPRLEWNRLIRHPRIEPIVRKLFPDQRRYGRLILPNVVGYFGKAHASRPQRIADISVGGFCMLSDQSWSPGTEMAITLQREDWDGDDSAQRVTVQAMVVRSGQHEIGFSIALIGRDFTSPESLDDNLRIDETTMAEFLAELQKPKLPRCLPVSYPRERPLLLSERTKLLLELAGSYRLSAASELCYSDRDERSIS